MAGALTAAIAAAFAGGVTPDPYFEYTTLLLPGSGTNGAQNNSFLDSGTANGGVGFPITRNGNTTQGTFSPFSQTGWGNYFDGSGDSLTTPSGSSISGTGNFTVEFWIYPTTFASGYQVPYINETSGGFAVLLNSTGTLSYGRALVAVDGTTTGTVTFNQWNHVAFVRSGTGSNQFICYINGSSAGSFTNSTNYSSGIVRLGTDAGGTSFPFLGYLSNVRNVTIAVYTGAFTPPTSPLAATQSAGTNISAITGTQTSLLTCQSNRFIDNSTNNFTITVNGNTSVVAFSPFNPTASWSAATNGGSGYFDGSGDYLSAASNAAFTLGSSSDFCIEGWVYSTGTPGTDAVIAGTWQNGSSAFANRWLLSLRTSGTAIYWWDSTGSPGITYTGITTNQWVHIAVVRNSGTITLYVNGVSRGTQTTNQAYTTQDSLKVGGGITGTSDFPGYISSLRVVLGSPVYTTAFTPPTAPLTAITNTSLLLNFTNAGIYDATSKNDLETVGNAQISTAQYKFPPSSMAFDGTGDYLSAANISRGLEMLTGDFTIECWIRFNVVGNGQIVTGLAATNTLYWQYYSSQLAFGQNNVSGIAATNWSPSSGVWYHIAVTRSGSTVRQFVDGTQLGSNATSSASFANGPIQIGDGGAGGFNGYIQDLRITKGYARYTSNFTPPTAAFPTL